MTSMALLCRTSARVWVMPGDPDLRSRSDRGHHFQTLTERVPVPCLAK